MADISFMAKSADDPKFCLLIFDLFTSKSTLTKKLKLFYQDVYETRKNKNQNMQIQTGEGFRQNEMNKLNQKYTVDVFQLSSNG